MITDHLLKGAENARTGKELASILNCEIRDITIMINRARHDGAPICAMTRGDHPGYYIAEYKEDVKEFTDSLKGRAIEIFKTRQALLKAADSLPERNVSKDPEEQITDLERTPDN